ncbi:MAG TPA: response regulator transcription factor [Roseiflexaceae bacterium]|nr:response regulator transcription factor [Roseiflexaceae bacterium]
MKILVADDDLELLGLVGFTLRQAGYLVIEAGDGAEALTVYQREQPDLVILDVNMPRYDGFEVCRRIRAEAPTPIMLLTVRSSEEDQVEGLDGGADDYLTKPFSPRTLRARVRALLRRAGIERPAALASGDLALDVEQQSVSLRDEPPIRLTNLEFRLLQYLLANAGHTLPSEKLTTHVWGYQGLGDRQLLKQLVHRLRQKIERDPAEPHYLITVAGVGYLLKTA